MATRYFYDLSYSEDDDNWYAEVFTQGGKEIYDTIVFSARRQAIADVQSHFPNAEMLNEFS